MALVSLALANSPKSVPSVNGTWKRILVLLGCLGMIAPSLLGVEINVGGTRLEVPVPAGYAPITSGSYLDFSKKFVPPTNEQFALFFTEADAAQIARGEVVVPERQCYVQSSKAIIQQFATKGDFAQLKDMMKRQNDDVFKKAVADAPKAVERMNKGLTEELNQDLKLSLNQMVPLPPHHENERSLAFSMLTKYQINDLSGKPEIFEGVVTATFVHVRGKVLYLYVNTEKKALEWSRTAAKAWAEQVIAANPSTGDTVERENKASKRGFDWNQVGTKALIGAVVGVLVAGVAALFRKKQT